MLVTYFVNFGWLGGRLFGRELFIRFVASAFGRLPSVCVFGYFPFGFDGRMWDLIVSVPDHCLSFYFSFYKSVLLLQIGFAFGFWTCSLEMDEWSGFS